MDILLYIVKLCVYVFLLVISGYVLVNTFIQSPASETRQATVNRLITHAAKVLLLLVLLAIFFQCISWEQQLDLEPKQLLELLWEGSTGKAWLAIFACSVILCFVLPKWQLASALITFAMLLAESINGHATGNSFLILFDFVHLIAAAIWVGGVLYLWLNWRDGKEQALRFVDKYTKLLWLTIASVSISGFLLMFFIVDSISYLLYTSWGQLLLLKISAVVVAIWLGYKASNSLRKRRMATGKGEESEGKLTYRPVVTELALLMLVIAFAAGISMLNPQPSAANAINHHEMGEELHYTVKLTPNAPGPNVLSLSLWTLEGEGEVQQVTMELRAADKNKAESRAFILESSELEDFFEFPGFIETRYSIEELRLPYPSDWEAMFTIEFVGGGYRQFTYTFSN